MKQAALGVVSAALVVCAALWLVPTLGIVGWLVALLIVCVTIVNMRSLSRRG